LEDGVLLRNAHLIANIPATLVQGRFDFCSPIGYAWQLKKLWPKSELAIVDSGHSSNNNLVKELIRATERYSPTHSQEH
jgi:proline iminopeptidase